jgi:hypothetical protein
MVLTQVLRPLTNERFAGGADGEVPQGNLLFDSAGNIFGMTYGGGNKSDCPLGGYEGCGVVFELTP